MVSSRALPLTSSVLVCLTASAVGVAGCQMPFEPGAFGTPIAMDRLRTEPYSFASTSGVNDRRREVVRTAEAWAALWQDIYAGSTPQPALPQVDFSREMIVVAAMGVRPTGGYMILLAGAYEGPSEITVRVRSVSPGPNCAVTLAVTEPVDIARVPRSEKPVRFHEETEVRNCS